MSSLAEQGLKGLLTGLSLVDRFEKVGIPGQKPEETAQLLLNDIQKNPTSAYEDQLATFYRAFQTLFIQNNDMALQLKAFDELLKKHEELIDFQEFLFDLFFVEALDQLGENADAYMESEAWVQLEQKTAGRGSEALNLFMYLTEVKESAIKANLDDFLDAFILDEDLDYQDDALVYEEVMDNRHWLDLPYRQLVAKAEDMATQTAMPELFTPLFCFFKSPEKSTINIMACLQAGGNHKRNTAISAMLQFFYHGENCVNQDFSRFIA